MHALASIDIHRLPRDVDVLLGVIEQLHSQYSSILGSLHQQLQTLRRLHFGAKSEKLPGQAELFTEVLHVPKPPLDQIEVNYKRARRGRPALPKDLPRSRIDYDLSEAEKAQFDSIERIGEEISETLEYTPAQLKVIEHARAFGLAVEQLALDVAVEAAAAGLCQRIAAGRNAGDVQRGPGLAVAAAVAVAADPVVGSGFPEREAGQQPVAERGDALPVQRVDLHHVAAGDAMQDAAREFGLGAPSGVSLPYEKAGVLPTPERRAQLHAGEPDLAVKRRGR